MRKHQPHPRPRRKPFAQGGRAFKREARQARYRAEGLALVRSAMRAKQEDQDLANIDLAEDDPLGLEGY